MGVFAVSLCAQGVDDDKIVAQVIQGDGEQKTREILRAQQTQAQGE